jgi:hypothetical protein
MSAFKREPIQAKKREETDSTTVQASRHLRKLDRDVFRSAFPPRHFTQKGAQEELQGLLAATKPPWKPSSRPGEASTLQGRTKRARESKRGPVMIARKDSLVRPSRSPESSIGDGARARAGDWDNGRIRSPRSP